jgi:hypothetical protein
LMRGLMAFISYFSYFAIIAFSAYWGGPQKLDRLLR